MMSMTIIHTRVPLAVEVIFAPDGQMNPVRLFFEGRTYDIDRILHVRPKKPRKVASIAPLAYKVIIEGVEKEIFYEAETNTWFSVKVQYV